MPMGDRQGNLLVTFEELGLRFEAPFSDALDQLGITGSS